jgi:hypothetical protein
VNLTPFLTVNQRIVRFLRKIRNLDITPIATMHMNARDRTSITTTELVRGLPAAIDQVRISRRPLRITRGRRTVALLQPPAKAGLPIDQLAELLARHPALNETAMAKDLKKLRDHATLPANAWES